MVGVGGSSPLAPTNFGPPASRGLAAFVFLPSRRARRWFGPAGFGLDVLKDDEVQAIPRIDRH